MPLAVALALVVAAAALLVVVLVGAFDVALLVARAVVLVPSPRRWHPSAPGCRCERRRWWWRLGHPHRRRRPGFGRRSSCTRVNGFATVAVV